jgi:hypothetical protein
MGLEGHVVPAAAGIGAVVLVSYALAVVLAIGLWSYGVWRGFTQTQLTDAIVIQAVQRGNVFWTGSLKSRMTAEAYERFCASAAPYILEVYGNDRTNFIMKFSRHAGYNQPEIMLPLLRANGGLLEHCGAAVRADPPCVRAAITEDSWYLRYAADTIKNNPEVMAPLLHEKAVCLSIVVQRCVPISLVLVQQW